jgi:predicted dehydrogenase
VIGNIGLGGMGSGHVQPDAAALCDVDANHLAANAKRVQGNPLLCKDYRRVLDRKDIDAVMIATPDHWHASMMVHACQAGKDVYVEKPACRTIEEGHAMVNAAKRYGRVVQVGSQGRSTPAAHAACEYIRNGQLGTVKRVDVWHEKNWTEG